ncbi:MAG: hypothetical protein LUC30_07915 [Clostridiales bacterium]|nr:hypothetical protein [Clostridiales bacterium]
MRHNRGALMILPIVLLLSGCGLLGQSTEAKAQALRAAYQAMAGFRAEAEITADYGDRAYAYTVTLSGDADEGTMTVTAPASIAGTGAAWSGGSASLEYEGISLETGPLSPDGLSPADAMPVILAACQSGSVVESGSPAWGEDGESLYLLLQNPKTADGESRVAVWADPETYALRQADILWEENRVISVTFSSFTLEEG